MSKMSVIIALAACLLAGCNFSGRKRRQPYETVTVDPNRDTETARRENARGKALLKAGKPAEAEKAFKAALTADLFYGPAHNNLAIAYYRRKKFYLAAWEFQYAATLLPNKPEPKNNLGIVLEAVGRLADAQKNYAAAMALEPDNPRFIGNLARCRVRLGQRTPETRDLLQQLVLKDTRPEWVDWARRELIRMPAPETAPPTLPPPAPSTQPAKAPSK